MLFVLGHMSGNFLMFKGAEAMHEYALLLRTSMPLLYVIRAVLLLAVILHVVAALQLTARSRAARPNGYTKIEPQVTTFAARTMKFGGVLLLVFIVFHIAQITLGWVGVPDFVHLDPYNNLRNGLRNPFIAGFYILAMAALGLHLYHGTWAVARTLGVARPSHQPLKRRLAIVLAVVIAVGFAVIPIAVLAGAFPDAPSPVTVEGH